MMRKYGMLIWRIVAMTVIAIALGYFISQGEQRMIILFSVLLVVNIGFTIVLIRKQRMQDKMEK